MLKKASATKGILLLGAVLMSTAHAAEPQVRIRSLFDINEAFCAIKTNDVLGMDNRYSALAGKGLGTSSTNSMLVLENGVNDITIEIGALGWFSKKNLDQKEREQFNVDSSCKIALTLFEGDSEKTLTKFNVSIDKNGVPQADNSGSSNEKIFVKKILARQVEKGHLDDKYYIENYFPEGMTLYQFTKKITLKGVPEWRWVKSSPFTGQPQQVQALKSAYVELWRLFSMKDNKAIKYNMQELLQAWSISNGSSVDDIYNNHKFVEGFKNPDFQMIPINWDDYTIEVMNKGRLVRFVNKSDPTVYPLSYYITGDDGKKKMRWFTPIFSLVDGKFIPVI